MKRTNTCKCGRGKGYYSNQCVYCAKGLIEVEYDIKITPKQAMDAIIRSSKGKVKA